MSGSEDQSGAGRREVAYRLFAAEFEDSDFSYSESDEERAPNYVVTPTGARVNRVFVVGVLTEVEQAGEEILRARVVDPTGAFVVYAGQYQPDAQAFLDRADTPAFVAVTGKARTFQPEDSDVTYTSIRPENVNAVDAGTRDRWTVQCARQTLDRVATMAGALQREERGDDLRRALEDAGVDVGLAAGIPLAIDHYGTTGGYLDAVRDLAIGASEVVAGDRDEVDPLTASPDTPESANLAALAGTDVDTSLGGESESVPTAIEATSASGSPGTGDSTGADEATGTGESADTGSAGETTESADETADSTPTAEATGGSDSTGATASAETGGDAGAPGTAAETGSEGQTAATGVEAETGSDAETAPEEGTTAAETGTADDGGSDSDTAAGADGDTAETGIETGSDELGDFDPGEFELDEEEREEIEEEYGTEFRSGSEVGKPGEADIETPDHDELAGAETEADASAAETGTEPAAADVETDESTGEPAAASTDAADAEPAESLSAEESAEAGPSDEPAETEPADEPATDEPAETEPSAAEPAGAEPADDVDIEDAVMEVMRERDGGDGAGEDAIVETVGSTYGFDADAAREAIQDALMDGRCYEPQDGVFKPI